MASQYTVLRQYAPYVSPYNVDLIKDVAMYKQGKVDAARQKIYTQMDYLMGQDIAKESDRAYMENKMAVTIADINERFRGVDLSSDGVTRAIQGEISNVLDDTVINAIAGTKEGKRMKQYLSDIQQNHPELYSAANAYVAMKPYTQWLNDGKTGSRLGDLNYVPYTDYNKELGTKMEELRKIHKGTKFTQPLLDKDGNPTGATQEITIDQMSPEQIATMAMGSLSDKAKQQMMVEATYMVDSNPDAYSANAVRMYTDAITNQGQEYVSKLEAELAGAESNPEKKKQLEQEIIRAKANVTSMKMYRDSITDQSYDPYQGAMKVIENNFANNAARMYAYDNSQYILKKDELYWAQMNYNQKEREIAKNDELKRLALEWKINLGKAYFGLKQSEIEANLGYKYDALRQAADFKSADLGLGYEKLKEQQRYNTERIKNLSTGKMGRSGAKSIQMALGSESPFTITRNPVETSSEINIGQMTAAKFQETYTGIGNAAAKLSTALGGETMNKIRSFINKEIQDNGDTSAYKNLSSEEQLLKYIKENGGVGNAFFSQEGINHKQATDSYMELNRWIDAMDVQYDRIKEEIAINNDKKEIYADNIAKKLGGVKNDTAYGLALAKMNQGLYVSGNKAQTVFSKSNAGLLRDVLSKEGLDLDKFIDLNIDGNYQMKDLSLDSINAMTEKERAFYVGMRYNNSHGTSGDMVFGNGMKLSDVYDFDSRAIDNEVTKAINTVRAKYLMEESPNSATIDVVTTEGKTGFEESTALRKIYTTKMPEAPIGKSDTSGGSIMSYTLTPIKERSDNGERRYALTVNHSGTRRPEDTVEVSESELTGAGINVGSIINQDNVDIGGYKSGMTYCAFGSVSDDNYQKFLENNKIDPRLSSVNGIKRIYSDLITKEGTGLDGMPAQQDMLLRAASAILDHADRLAIQVEGYDPTSGYGYGYTTRLYLMTDGRPKEIEKYDTGGVLFADRLSEEMAICPQLRIVQFLNDALADEVSRIKDMKDRGIEVTNLDRDGKLYTLLNALDNTNNNGNGW